MLLKSVVSLETYGSAVGVLHSKSCTYIYIYTLYPGEGKGFFLKAYASEAFSMESLRFISTAFTYI